MGWFRNMGKFRIVRKFRNVSISEVSRQCAICEVIVYVPLMTSHRRLVAGLQSCFFFGIVSALTLS